MIHCPNCGSHDFTGDRHIEGRHQCLNCSYYFHVYKEHKIIAYDKPAIWAHIENIVKMFPNIVYHNAEFIDGDHIHVYLSYGQGEIPHDLPERLKNEYPQFSFTLIINAW